MKKAGFVVLSAAGLLVNSCLVKSVHPWYDTGTVVFEPALLGDWSNPEEGIFLRFSQKGDNIFYDVEYVEDNDTTYFRAFLTRLDDELYLDYTPRPGTLEGWTDILMLPLHSLMKTELNPGELVLTPPDYSWLTSRTKSGDLEEIQYQLVGDDPVLTSPTPALRQFIVRYGSQEGFWGDPLKVTRGN
ncbi:MAG: hypothetical protein ACE5LH_00345 [Fidelibacterota bacterium]